MYGLAIRPIPPAAWNAAMPCSSERPACLVLACPRSSHWNPWAAPDPVRQMLIVSSTNAGSRKGCEAASRIIEVLSSLDF